MTTVRYLVFSRADRHEWALVAASGELASAVQLADEAVGAQASDRAVVMEVSGVDALPMFTFRYQAKSV